MRKKENSDETNTRRRCRFMGVKRDGAKNRQIMRGQCLGRKIYEKIYEKIQFERCKQKMLFKLINDKYILMIYKYNRTFSVILF